MEREIKPIPCSPHPDPMVRASTTPSAAPAALEKAHFALWPLYRGTRAVTSSSTGAGRPGGWPRELADTMRVCNGTDTNAHIRPNGTS
eukprot:4018683-Prymnesium_polylepis.1